MYLKRSAEKTISEFNALTLMEQSWSDDLADDVVTWRCSLVVVFVALFNAPTLIRRNDEDGSSITWNLIEISLFTS